MPDKQEQNKTKAIVTIPLHFNLPIDKPSVYATNMLIQMSEYEIVISFYEAQPPIFTEKDDNIEMLKNVGIRADCVAKVTVAKERFKSFVAVMNNFAEQIKKEGLDK